MLDYLALLFPFLLFGALAFALYRWLSRLLDLEGWLPALLSLAVSPLIAGELLYVALYLWPGQTKLVYLVLPLAVIALLCLLTWRLPIKVGALRDGYRDAQKLLFANLGLLEKILLGIIGLITILAAVRMMLWPVNWADQIAYITQAYSFAEARDLGQFFGVEFFRDNQIVHQMNPAIRPGLPMVNAYYFLLRNSLTTGALFSQLVTLYYFSLLLVLIARTSWLAAASVRNSLVALTLTLSTYLFFNHAVSGFKEMIFAVLILLIINLAVAVTSKASYRLWAVIGALMGLMAFVHYFGVVLSALTFLALLLGLKLPWQGWLKAAGIGLAGLLVFSANELVALYRWVTRTDDTIALDEPISSELVSNSLGEGTSQAATFIQSGVTGVQELASYQINSLADLYIKGKLQGLFQLQYYGFIYLLLLVVLLFCFRKLLSNTAAKIILLFVLLYVFFVFDPFNLNRFSYAYVFSISHKYTVFLVPFAALLIASQTDWLVKTAGRIKPGLVGTIAAAYLLIYGFFLLPQPELLVKMAARLVPVHQSLEYYQHYLNLAALVAAVVASIALIVAVLTLTKRSWQQAWSRYSLPFTALLTAGFLLPFLFFFNTNYGIANTLRYSFAAKAVKLAQIPGWEDLYGSVNDINRLSPEHRIIFLGQSVDLLAIHLEHGLGNITEPATVAEYRAAQEPERTRMIEALIRQSDYVFTKKNVSLLGAPIQDLPFMEIYAERGQELILKVKK